MTSIFHPQRSTNPDFSNPYLSPEPPMWKMVIAHTCINWNSINFSEQHRLKFGTALPTRSILLFVLQGHMSLCILLTKEISLKLHQQKTLHFITTHRTEFKIVKAQGQHAYMVVLKNLNNNILTINKCKTHVKKHMLQVKQHPAHESNNTHWSVPHNKWRSMVLCQ